ncbi:MAG: hypothetical protein K9K80_02065 [Spirochaetia bacterium]|nr:hypothetical protein [Spirochaetia bacterium]
MNQYLSTDISKMVTDIVTHVEEKAVPENLPTLAENVIDRSRQEIEGRKDWGKGPGHIHGGFSYTASATMARIYNDRPYAYLRQWGETIRGKQYITPVRKKYLFINRTGLSTEQFKSLSKKEREERFRWGEDYFFAKKVEIVANPYIPAPHDQLPGSIRGLASMFSEIEWEKASEDTIMQIVRQATEFALKYSRKVNR